MSYHVLLPSVEYADFLIKRLETIDRNCNCVYPAHYPSFAVIKVNYKGRVCMGWNNIDSTSNPEVSFTEIEEVIKEEHRKANRINERKSKNVLCHVAI